MAHAEFDGRAMTLDEQLAMTTILLIAGNETTRGLLSGTAKLLSEHPDQRDVLVQRPELIPTAVEEFLLYPAANRDERIWDRADMLDVTRDPDPSHLAFGFAEHFCLGASLARREARIVITQLLSHFSSWDITGDITRAQNHMTPGITRMPVVFHR